MPDTVNESPLATRRRPKSESPLNLMSSTPTTPQKLITVFVSLPDSRTVMIKTPQNATIANLKVLIGNSVAHEEDAQYAIVANGRVWEDAVGLSDMDGFATGVVKVSFAQIEAEAEVEERPMQCVKCQADTCISCVGCRDPYCRLCMGVGVADQNATTLAMECKSCSRRKAYRIPAKASDKEENLQNHTSISACALMSIFLILVAAALVAIVLVKRFSEYRSSA